MSIPEDRDSVVAHLRATTPDFDEWAQEDQDRTVDKLILVARELNEQAELWDSLPHEVWES